MDIQIKQYLTNLLLNIEPYVLNSDELKKVSRDKSDFILRKLLRKEFRRKKVSEKTERQIREKVDLSIKGNIAIHLAIPFGGYKHFWNPSHPEPDWAELFHFRYLTDLVLPILAIHRPGVILEYISEDMILNRMNNYPVESLDKYSESFNRLLTWYSKLVPENLKFKFFRVGDRFDKQKVISEVESLLLERRDGFIKLSAEDQEKELHRSYRSVFWNGDINLSNLSEDQKRNRVVDSRLIELAYYDTEGKPEYLGDYFWRDNHICINFSFGLSPDNVFEDLTLGSSYGSIVDFWIGRGVLENNNGKIYTRIVSKNQYEQASEVTGKSEIKINGLDFANFKTIDVVRKN